MLLMFMSCGIYSIMKLKMSHNYYEIDKVKLIEYGFRFQYYITISDDIIIINIFIFSHSFLNFYLNLLGHFVLIDLCIFARARVCVRGWSWEDFNLNTIRNRKLVYIL